MGTLDRALVLARADGERRAKAKRVFPGRKRRATLEVGGDVPGREGDADGARERRIGERHAVADHDLARLEGDDVLLRVEARDAERARRTGQELDLDDERAVVVDLFFGARELAVGAFDPDVCRTCLLRATDDEGIEIARYARILEEDLLRRPRRTRRRASPARITGRRLRRRTRIEAVLGCEARGTLCDGGHGVDVGRERRAKAIDEALLQHGHHGRPADEHHAPERARRDAASFEEA